MKEPRRALLIAEKTSRPSYEPRDTEEEGDAAFRRYGHSKDHRPDLPQIVIGLAVTREGIPVRVWCWPGNTNDETVLPEVKDGLRGWRLGRVVTVVDRGLSSDANLDYLRRAGGHWIAGERMRDGSADALEALSRQGRYQTVRDNLRVKEVRLDSTPDRRWIVCHNPVEAERDKAQRDAAVLRLEAELDAIAAGRARDAARAKKTKAKRKPSEEPEVCLTLPRRPGWK
jgi:transposase